MPAMIITVLNAVGSKLQGNARCAERLCEKHVITTRAPETHKQDTANSFVEYGCILQGRYQDAHTKAVYYSRPWHLIQSLLAT